MSFEQKILDTMQPVSLELKNYCLQFFKYFNLNYFAYLRVANNYICGLGTNHDYNKLFIKKGYHTKNELFFTNVNFNNKIILADHLNDYCNLQKINNDAEIHNHSHLCYIVEKRTDSREVFVFGAEKNNADANDFYLNNLDILKLFTMQFKGAMRQHKQLVKIKNLMLPLSSGFSQTIETDLAGSKPIHRDKFLNDSLLNRFYVDDKVYFTNKEIECLKWLLKGKSADEASIILATSKRTIEAHLYNIRKKLGCYKNIQIFNRLYKLGLLSILLQHG